jgi:(p)ppGpp synthase/HD superfamily hydrolase
MTSIVETIEFIKAAFGNKTDKIGVPYWKHPVSVMNRLGPDASDDEKLVALLHDVIEDTHYTAADLLAMGYPANVVEAVVLLTKPDDDTRPYAVMIDELVATGNAMAMRVKIADNEDNLDPERVAKLPADKRHLSERYERSRAILRPALDRCVTTQSS